MNPNDSFIIDGGSSGRGVWAWVGRRASRKEREEAMRNANGFIKEKNYPPSTHVIKILFKLFYIECPATRKVYLGDHFKLKMSNEHFSETHTLHIYEHMNILIRNFFT